jgi:uncharacterized membrane protein YdjX (TVP38/TMEM64 family)
VTASGAARTRHRLALALALAALFAAWAVWSYRSGGVVAVLAATAGDPAGGLAAMRAYVLSWGALAPAAYVLAVTVEVLIAPFPGTLLYAPAGAIFGGWWGGTLSLAGNVLGATIAAWIGAALGEPWIARRLASDQLDRFRARLLTRAAWIVFLLRVNPFTSSDVVSYAAGALGVPARKVAIGTLAGMAPLCYLQAYLSETLFTLVPGGIWVVAILGVVYLIVVVALVVVR